MSDTETAVRGIYQAINTGDLDLLGKYVADDYIEHTDGYQGVEPFRQQISAFRPPSLTCTSASTTCWSTGTGSRAGRPWQVPMPVT